MRSARSNRRRAGWLFVFCLFAVLTGCGGPDPIEILKADKPHDVRAVAACNDYLKGRERQYLVAAKSATLGDVRAHIDRVMGSTAAGRDELSILAGKPGGDYVTLCLLDYPTAALIKAHLPPSVGPMTLALLGDGGSVWADPGPNS